MPLANTEYTFNFGPEIKKLLLQARNLTDLKISYKEGESATNYFTLKCSSTYFEDQICGPFTLAIQSDEPNTIIEIVTWCHYD